MTEGCFLILSIIMKYRIITKEHRDEPRYIVQVRKWFGWVTIKEYHADPLLADGNAGIYEIETPDDTEYHTIRLNGHYIRVRNIGAAHLSAEELLEHLQRDY